MGAILLKNVITEKTICPDKKNHQNFYLKILINITEHMWRRMRRATLSPSLPSAGKLLGCLIVLYLKETKNQNMFEKILQKHEETQIMLAQILQKHNINT